MECIEIVLLILHGISIINFHADAILCMIAAAITWASVASKLWQRCWKCCWLVFLNISGWKHEIQQSSSGKILPNFRVSNSFMLSSWLSRIYHCVCILEGISNQIIWRFLSWKLESDGSAILKMKTKYCFFFLFYLQIYYFMHLAQSQTSIINGTFFNKIMLIFSLSWSCTILYY